LVELGWVLLVLDDHDELEDEEGQRDNDHQAAEEPLEFDVGLIV